LDLEATIDSMQGPITGDGITTAVQDNAMVGSRAAAGIVHAKTLVQVESHVYFGGGGKASVKQEGTDEAKDHYEKDQDRHMVET